MRYDLTDLRLFHAIAEAQNLSGGAAAMYITASSASYRLKNLEHSMGVELFTRSPRGMRLTPAGEALLDHVREVLAGITRMQADIARFSAGLRGNIRMWANSSSLNGFILPSVSRFLLANPDINIDLEERPSGTIVAGVADRVIDVGVFAGSASAGADTRIVRYAQEDLIIVTPLGHPLAQSDRVDFAAALDFDFVCMSRGSSNFHFLQETSRQAGAHLNVRVHGHDFAAVLRLVEAGVGIALVPRSVAEKELRDMRIAGLALPDPWARRELHLVTREAEPLPDYLQAFVTFLLDDPRVAATRDPS
ncbi:LysR family transcriptional regulator [Saccharopolyspora sp. NPDC000359]|uniref:LysR family transcriptional regulator n=1 Tax=Saccharopolyspora sp. NPDC000359 TaxID=3154251 RepID=UPI00331D772A